MIEMDIEKQAKEFKQDIIDSVTGTKWSKQRFIRFGKDIVKIASIFVKTADHNNNQDWNICFNLLVSSDLGIIFFRDSYKFADPKRITKTEGIFNNVKRILRKWQRWNTYDKKTN